MFSTFPTRTAKSPLQNCVPSIFARCVKRCVAHRCRYSRTGVGSATHRLSARSTSTDRSDVDPCSVVSGATDPDPDPPLASSVTWNTSSATSFAVIETNIPGASGSFARRRVVTSALHRVSRASSAFRREDTARASSR